MCPHRSVLSHSVEGLLRHPTVQHCLGETKYVDNNIHISTSDSMCEELSLNTPVWLSDSAPIWNKKPFEPLP